MYTRSISNFFGGGVLALAAASLLAIGLGFGVTASAAEPKKPAPLGVSKKVIPPLKAASEAFTAQQYDAALAKLQEADAVEGKTPYDQFRIDELRAIVYINQNKYAEPFAIYEKNLSAPPEFFEPQIAAVRGKVLTQLAFRNQAHDKVLKYGREWMSAHPDDTSVLDVMARSSYIGKDYKSALEFSQAAIAIAEANPSGKPPEEVWLQLVSSTSSSLNDPPGMMAGYEKLVRYYPKPEHWSKSLDALLALEKNEAAQLPILRLMADTGTLKHPEYFMEYSQRAIDKAMPGEAAKVLAEGFEKKLLGATEKDKAKHQSALTAAQAKAKADRAQLPEIEKEVKASKSAGGQLEAGLGLAYFSHQMYEQAVPLLESGIAKGNLRNLEDTRMVLGISYLRLGQKDKAREEFKKVSANAAYAKVAPFWVARSYN